MEKIRPDIIENSWIVSASLNENGKTVKANSDRSDQWLDAEKSLKRQWIEMADKEQGRIKLPAINAKFVIAAFFLAPVKIEFSFKTELGSLFTYYYFWDETETDSEYPVLVRHWNSPEGSFGVAGVSGSMMWLKIMLARLGIR